MDISIPSSASTYSVAQYGTSPAARAPIPAQRGTSAERIHEAAKQYESVFLAQMLKPMFETIKVDENFGGGAAEETWRGILVEKYADEITNAGGIGLTDVIEKQMLKLQEINNGHKASTATNPATSTEAAGAETQTGTAEQIGTEARSNSDGATTLSARSPRSFSTGYVGTSGGDTGYETALSLVA